MIVFSIGFSAMFLGNVLFLTRVWGYTDPRGRASRSRSAR